MKQGFDHLNEHLRAGGLTMGSPLMVHSAFSSLGKAGVNALSLCQNLAGFLQNGTLLMPTMTWRSVTKDHPVFHINDTPSHTGYLSEVFRTQLATKRSLHPTHSVAGWGQKLDHLLGEHHKTSTPCAGQSPFARHGALDDAFILLIQVGFESVTLIHHLEETLEKDIYLVDEQDAIDFTLQDNKGQTHKMHHRGHCKTMRDFHQYGKDLSDQNKLHTFKWNDTDFILFRAQDLLSLVHARLTNEAKGNYVPYSYLRK